MSVNFTLIYCKGKLQEVDYNQRLKLIYEWVKTSYIKQGEFITLINFAFDLDLLPNED
jgi:hypothetical protein